MISAGLRRSAAAAGVVALLTGCGGSSSAPVAALPHGVATTTPGLSTSSSGRATVTVSFRIPLKKRASSSASRRPDYISSGTQAVAFFDGTTVAGVVNVDLSSDPQTSTVVYAGGPNDGIANASCSGADIVYTCTATLATTVGAHTFFMVTYDEPVSTSSPSPTPSSSPKPTAERRLPDALYENGIILAEGQSVPLSLQPGTNPGATITLNGVAATTEFAEFEEPDGVVVRPALRAPNQGVVGDGQYDIEMVIEDASGNVITTPGTFDNGPVIVSEQDANGILTITAGTFTTPPDTSVNVDFFVSCNKPGTATIQATANTKPDTAYVARLPYNSSDYASSPIGTTTFQCTSGELPP
ncbi:MAG TPA: hypothetical protein VFB22_02280 [Candidatus Baltobacteraceae bacterium]|nr:hypothetical protein [Candidatus Baltobacteraceae bacterium]